MTNLNKLEKINHNKKIIIYLFSFLPISFLLGNGIVNANIVIINVFFLFTCYYQKKWSWIKDKYFFLLIFIWFYLIINSAFLSYEIPLEYSGIDSIKQQKVFPPKLSTCSLEAILISVA